MDTTTERLQEEDLSFFEKVKFLYRFVAKILLYAMFLILILMAIMFALYFADLLKNIKTGENKPPLFNAYIIISPSMVPTINVEDAIIVKRVDAKELKKGDIITFTSTDSRYSGLTITHRIVGIEKSQNDKLLFTTKGDANNVEDGARVKPENIYGKVILRIPMIGYIQYFLSQSYGWLIAIVIPSVGVIIYDVMKMAKAIKGDEKVKSKKKDNKNDKLKKRKGQKSKKKDVEVLDDAEDIEVLKENNDVEVLSDKSSIEVLDDEED